VASPAETPTWTDDHVVAVHWASVKKGSYKAYVWVYNGGTEPGNWEVRVTLPPGATVDHAMAVEKTFDNGVWVFSPNRGHLRPGLVYLFGFSGATASKNFALKSCIINGSACAPFT
jgi:hypothetical protein